MNRITASCIITRHAVRKNGEIFFEDPSQDLPGFLLSVYRHLDPNYPRFYKMDNLSKLGWLAVEILLKNGFRGEIYREEEIGVVLTNANSSLDTDLKYFESAKDIPSPSLFVYTLPNIMVGEICIRNHFKGEGVFFISKKFDPGFVVQYAGDLLDTGILKACICGWVDLLDDDYRAVIFLVERRNLHSSLSFTKENIEKMILTE